MAPSVDGDTKVGATSYIEEEKALKFKIINLRLSKLALRYPSHFKYCQYILTVVLEESSTYISCLHKQIPFVPFLVGSP